MTDAQATRMWRPWPAPKVRAAQAISPSVEPKSPLQQAVLQYVEVERN